MHKASKRFSSLRYPAGFIMITLAVLLASCSMFQSAEKKARQLAVDTAVAFFTFDYQNPSRWMEPVNDQDYYQNLIQPDVAPRLIPYLQKYFIISTAEFVSVEEVARGYNVEGKADVVMWEILLNVTPAWPGNGPPSPLDKAPYNIPWSAPDTTTVHAIGLYKLGIWNVKLISTSQVKDVLAALTIPE